MRNPLLALVGGEGLWSDVNPCIQVYVGPCVHTYVRVDPGRDSDYSVPEILDKRGTLNENTSGPSVPTTATPEPRVYRDPLQRDMLLYTRSRTFGGGSGLPVSKPTPPE